MPHSIYSGEGEYDPDTLMAVYTAYLPKDFEDKYQFKTNTIYNISCKDYPNRILLFMRLADVPNTDLAKYTNDGTTTDAPQTIMFSLDSTFIEDLDSSTIKLDLTKDIKLVLFHDAFYEISHIKDMLNCAPDADFEVGVQPNKDEQLESPVMIMPKRGKTGFLLRK